MSSSTMRLFVNDNRISTAVRMHTGLLQVYPTKRRFVSDVEWKQFWENELKPKIIMRFGDSEVSAPAPKPEPAPKPATSVPTVSKPEPKPTPKPKKASLSNWNTTLKGNFSATLPAGTYYIGDLCYVLGDDVYDGIFGGTGYESGIYVEKGTDRTFLVSSTAYGDGEYPGSDGNKFAVDAGIIGICSQDLMTKDDGGGHMYTFKRSVDCRFKNGRFTFTDGTTYLVVDTTGNDDAY